MKKYLLIVISLIIFPQIVLANSYVPAIAGLVKGAYTYSSSAIAEIKDKPRGTYLPGVFDSNVPSFSLLSQDAKDKIVKKRQEDKASAKARQQQLGAVEAAFDGKYIDVDISSQTLTAFQDRIPVYRFKISSGKASMPTPTGTFKILNKSPRAYSRKYNLYMPYWMAFRGDGYGLHELPEWKGGYKEGANHLGIPVSHGCVRLGVGAAGAIYNWVNIGDTVYIHK